MAKMYINVEMGYSIDIRFFTTKKSALANAKMWTRENKTYQQKWKITEIKTWEMRDDIGIGYLKYELDNFEKYAKIIAITKPEK